MDKNKLHLIELCMTDLSNLSQLIIAWDGANKDGRHTQRIEQALCGARMQAESLIKLIDNLNK